MLVRRSTFAATVLAAAMLPGCTIVPTPPAEAVAVKPEPAPAAVPPLPPLPPAIAPVTPVEAEPYAPAAQPALMFTMMTQGPVAALLLYADKVRPLNNNELGAELQRLGEPNEVPFTQMQVALVLAQTRVPADLARAVGLMQRVMASSQPEAQPLQALARLLVARYAEQRRVEEDRDKQAQQVRESQRRIDQLNERIEALRAIERSFARPNNAPPTPAAAPVKPAP